jgi:ring-1,2-phenylacetyl-CoA epoxidase subunit PaaD
MQASIEEIRALLSQVEDPEIPVLTIADLGILRSVEFDTTGQVVVTITPTYSGCPAMQTIEVAIKSVLQDANIFAFEVKSVLSPAWTTDWMTEAGREKLCAYGIAPPVGQASKRTLLGEQPIVKCPQCQSTQTSMVSQFGSTACKSLWKCHECKEPFDYFKCH